MDRGPDEGILRHPALEAIFKGHPYRYELQ